MAFYFFLFLNAKGCSYLHFLCLCASVCVLICVCRSYQRTSRTAVAVLTRANPGVDASSALGAALGPGAPGRPEDGLRAGLPLVAEPAEHKFMQ